MRFAALFMAAATLSACVHIEVTNDDAPTTPSLAIAVGEAAPAKARFYVDCMRQAIDGQHYDREENLIRFHCTGEPAQRFYDGLAARSARVGSEYTADGRTLRFTERLQENTVGIDYCARDAAGAYSCTVIFNAGDFLAED